jgi:hypothetical protein
VASFAGFPTKDHFDSKNEDFPDSITKTLRSQRSNERKKHRSRKLQNQAIPPRENADVSTLRRHPAFAAGNWTIDLTPHDV